MTGLPLPDTERRLAGRAASTATSVMSRSHSQGTEGYDCNRRRSLSSFHETSRRILRYGNDIQSHRERGYEQPV